MAGFGEVFLPQPKRGIRRNPALKNTLSKDIKVIKWNLTFVRCSLHNATTLCVLFCSLINISEKVYGGAIALNLSVTEETQTIIINNMRQTTRGHGARN